MNFKTIINNDVVAIICKFLRPKDILTLYNMYPEIFKKVSGIYKQRVGQELDMFFRWTLGESYSEFRKIMVSSNAMVSGSIILQLVLGERWPGHEFNRLDVDIFMFVNPDYTDNYQYSEDEITFYNHVEKFQLGYDDLHKFLYKKSKYGTYVTHSQYMDEMGENVILRVNNYSIKDTNIFQVVELNKDKYDSYEDFINETVDFDICKNIFRYTDNNSEDGFEINIQNLYNIINKTTTFNYVHSHSLSKKRRDKYVGRGFKFNYDGDPLGNYDPHM